MNRLPLSFPPRACILLAAGAVLALAAGPAPTGAAIQDALGARYDAARLHWDTGDFPRALEEFRALLAGPGADRFFAPIAVLTGELNPVREIAADGRAIRVSPDGLYAAYETGPRFDPLTRIVALDDPGRTAAEIRGSGLVFSPRPRQAAYLRVPAVPAVTALRREIESLGARPAPDRMALMGKTRELARLEAAASRIVLHDLATGKERVLDTDGWLKNGLAFSADGAEVYFAGARESGGEANDIFAASAKGVRPLTSGPGFKTNPAAVPGGRYLLYSVAASHPFPAPPDPAGKPGVAPATKPAPSGPPAREGRFAGSRQFVLRDLASGTAAVFDGTSPSFSADGSALVFLGQEGAESTLNLIKLGGELKPATVKKSAERFGSAALSPDGSRIVYELPFTRNGEIFAVGADGKNEVRISRDIEPDRAPRFVTADAVLAVRGEPRHSRAILYDLKTGSARRLFHNNTLRTIAPEYEWAAVPGGTRVLIAAERDGDTIAARRGVYLLDLTRTISRQDLLDRIDRSLAAEKDLRARAGAMVRPIRPSVQAAVDRVSITKIFDHESALFDLDSKAVTAPGNRKAAAYIFAELRSYGYAPEYQEFEARGTKTANVLAWLKGTDAPELIYVLSGHFDSNPRGPGADDNSSVTAVNLETARLLAGSPLPATVCFAFFTGEEAGLLGSREFVRVARENHWAVAADLNNDMIGWTNDHRLDDTIRYSNAGLRDIQHAAAIEFSRLVTYDARYVKSTDAASFFEAYGDIVGGLGSYPVLGNPYYHLPADLLETVNHQLLAEAAKYNTAAIMVLASSPAPVKDLKIVLGKDGRAEASWTPGPERGIAAYRAVVTVDGRPAGEMRVAEPRAALEGLVLKKGGILEIAVKAIASSGMESWDWARTSAIRS